MKDYLCNHCDFLTISQAKIEQHIKNTHSNTIPVLKIKEFKCETCSYNTAQKHALFRHYASVHKDMDSFKCPSCDFTSAVKPKLIDHKQKCKSGRKIRK